MGFAEDGHGRRRRRTPAANGSARVEQYDHAVVEDLMATRQATQLETPARAREGNTERDRERDTESMTERQREPEPELEPPHIDGAAPFHTQKAHTKPGGISSLYADYPAAVTEDLLMGGCRGVVATRDIKAHDELLHVYKSKQWRTCFKVLNEGEAGQKA